MEIKDRLLELMKDICPYGKSEDYFAIKFHTDKTENDRVSIHFYTDNYLYAIAATDKKGEEKDYLGCTYGCRKARTGEDWARGGDLPDGEFNKETWEKIKNSIIKNELVKIEESKEKEGDK